MPVNLAALQAAAEDFFETDVHQVQRVKKGAGHALYVLHLETHDADLPSEVIVRAFIKQRMPESIDSEVATINFVGTHTTIPVARVFFHESRIENAVGVQYIVQERINGEPLNKALDEEDDPEYELDLDAWRNLVSDYADIVSQLFRLRFSHIGALYEVPAGSSDHSSEESDFDCFVGPTCEPWFYRGHRRSLENLDVGPWESSSDWLAALVSNEVRYLRMFPRELEKELQRELGTNGNILDLSVDWALHGAEDRLRRLISLCNLGSGELGPDEDLVRLSRTFGLFHAHLLPHNIFIDMRTGRIKGITGWEDATTTPIWRIASIPYWLEWPGPGSEWAQTRPGKETEETKLDLLLSPVGANGKRNGVSEDELADLRTDFCERVAYEDQERLFGRCLEDGFFDQIKIVPHLLYNIWERDQIDSAILELEEWETATFQ